MSPWIAFAAWIVEVLLCAALAATPRGARAGAWVAIALLPLPALVAMPSWPVLCFLDLVLLFAYFRAADLAADPTPRSFAWRLLHLVAVIDTRKATRIEPRFAGGALVRGVVAGAIAAGALWVVFAADAFTGWRHYVLRWYVGGAPFAFAVFAAVDALLVFAAAPFGWKLPALNLDPWLATSVSEFWSRRWNNVVNGVLREHAYRAFAGRGALPAAAVTFAASAALHGYLIGLLLGPGPTAAWMVFFLAQPMLLWLERRLDVRRWRPALGRAWTLGTLGLLFPLFIEPVLRLFDPSR
jgi:hypothetical protein